MISTQAWAKRPKWHHLETPRSYAQRQCRAAGVPFDFAERALTSRAQPNIHRVWIDDEAAARTVEATAGRPAGHYLRMKRLAQPDSTRAYPQRFLCRLCSAGETIEQIPHDRENFCLRHPRQMVWVGPGTEPDTQVIVPFDPTLRNAELSFRRLVATGRVTTQLHGQVWAMVRDNETLSAQNAETGQNPCLMSAVREIDRRAHLYRATVRVLQILSNRAHCARWRTQSAADLRLDITATLGLTNSDILVERVILWLRPLRRHTIPTKFRPLEAALDTVDVPRILDTTANYPLWILRHPKAISEWDWDRNPPTRDPWSGVDVSHKAWWLCEEGHSWEASPHVRGSAETNCEYCIGMDFWPGHTDLGTLRPDIAAEWDTTPGANRGDPHHVSATSARKINWRCTAHEHTWPAQVRSRTAQESKCPYCSGSRAIPGETDLATLHPGLAAEWDHELNDSSITPETVTPGSDRVVWWHGHCDHSWDAAVGDRCSGHGCPYCSNQRTLAGFNDLATTHPHLAEQWDRVNSKSACEVTAGSDYPAVWRCALSHTWELPVWGRTKDKTGCPVCANRVVLAGFNDLGTLDPHLASEWDRTPGANDRTPSEVTVSSSYEAQWRCAENHTWPATVANRHAGSGCPSCSGRVAIPGATDLATRRPDIAAQWDPSNDCSPNQVTVSSHVKVSWICHRNHSWPATVKNRTSGCGCPYCTGKLPIPGETDLATLRPDLAAQWDSSNALSPTEVTVGSGRKVTWHCACGYTWPSRVQTRTRRPHARCPECRK